MKMKRSQSAMEYLMTYGWAILILVVALSAFLMLGVFNYGSFTQKALPGTCSIFRPHGPGTSSLIQTQGVCTGLQPQYVAYLNGSQYLNLPVTPAYSTLTLSAWANLNSSDLANRQDILNTAGDFLNTQGGRLCFWVSGVNSAYVCSPAGISSGKWYMLTATYNGIAEGIYVNGTLVYSYYLSGTPTGAVESGNIGACYHYCGGIGYVDGYIANVQYYKTALSSNEIKSMYIDGIGGDPISLQNIVAWWPLNDNGNDYSGNNYNATEVAANAVQYTTNWQSGYSQP